MHSNGRQRISTGGFGRGSEFGFEKLLQTFNLLDPVRHTLGFGYYPYWPEKNLLPFFGLVADFSPLPAPHNRQVEGGGPTYRRPLPFKSFWAHHFL
jgi:hypothetical protein